MQSIHGLWFTGMAATLALLVMDVLHSARTGRVRRLHEAREDSDDDTYLMGTVAIAAMCALWPLTLACMTLAWMSGRTVSQVLDGMARGGDE